MAFAGMIGRFSVKLPAAPRHEVGGEERVQTPMVVSKVPADDAAQEIHPAVTHDIESSRNFEGKYWLELAKNQSREGNHFTAAMMAAKSIGFVGFGLEHESSQYPALLKPEHGSVYEEAVTLANQQWLKSPELIWRTSNPSHVGPRKVELAYSPDGKLLATLGEKSSEIQLWNTVTGEVFPEPIKTGRQKGGLHYEVDGNKYIYIPTDLMFSCDGKFLAYQHKLQGEVHLHDMKLNETRVLRFPGVIVEMLGASFHPSEPCLLIYDKDTILFWDYLQNKKLAEEHQIQEGAISSVHFDRQGKRVVICHTIKNAEVRNFNGGNLGDPLVIHPTKVKSAPIKVRKPLKYDKLTDRWIQMPQDEVDDSPGWQSPHHCFFPSDDTMATQFLGHPWIDVWDLDTGELAGASYPSKPWFQKAVCINKEGNLWVGVARGNGISSRLLMHRTDDDREDFETIANGVPQVSDFEFSPDGKRLALGSIDGVIRLLDMETKEWVVDVPEVAAVGGLQEIRIAKDGTSVLARSHSAIQSIDPVTGKPLEKHEWPGKWCGFLSEDGSLVVVIDRRVLPGKDPGAGISSFQVQELATGKVIMEQVNLDGYIQSVTISPNNELVGVMYQQERAAQVWDIRSGKEACKPMSKSEMIKNPPDFEDEYRKVNYPGSAGAMAFSPDGKQLITGGSGNELCVWSVSTGEMIGDELGKSYPNREIQAGHILYSLDGSAFLTASAQSSEVFFWNAAARKMNGEPLITGEFTVAGDNIMGVVAMALSPNGKYLAVGHKNHSISLWDVDRRIRLGEPMNAHAAPLAGLEFSPDGRFLVVGSKDGIISMWRLKHLTTGLVNDGLTIRPLFGRPDEARVLTVSSNLNLFATTDGSAKEVQLWDLRSGSKLGVPIARHEDDKISCAFIYPDDSYLAVGSGARITFWDINTGLLNGKGITQNRGGIVGMAVCDNGEFLMSWSKDLLHAWDMENQGRSTAWDFEGYRPIAAFAADPKSRALAMSNYATTYFGWCANMMEDRTFKGVRHNKLMYPYGLEFSGDGQVLLATYGSDEWDNPQNVHLRKVHRYDAKTMDPIGDEIWTHGHCILHATISPNHAWIATSSCDGKLRIWDTRSGDLLACHLVGFSGALKFAPDSRKLIALVGGQVDPDAEVDENGLCKDFKSWNGCVERIVECDLRALMLGSPLENSRLVRQLESGNFMLTEAGLIPKSPTWSNLYKVGNEKGSIEMPEDTILKSTPEDMRKVLGLLRQAQNWRCFVDLYLERGADLKESERFDVVQFLIALAGMEASKPSSAYADHIFGLLERLVSEEMVKTGKLDLTLLGLCRDVVKIEDKQRGDVYWKQLMTVLMHMEAEARDRCLRVIEEAEN